MRANEIKKKMFSFFQEWYERIVKNLENLFNPIVEGIKEEDDNKVAHELEYFINCHSCKLSVNTIRDAMIDKINKDILTTFLTT